MAEIGTSVPACQRSLHPGRRTRTGPPGETTTRRVLDSCSSRLRTGGLPALTTGRTLTASGSGCEPLGVPRRWVSRLPQVRLECRGARFTDGPRCSREYVRTWILGLVDDHSRFVIGLTILTGTTAAGVLSWLDECFELCGQPLELMSD